MLAGQETYSQRANAAFESILERRSALVDAAFLLPHLKEGMRLLDVGCGPGTITLDLAERLAPGQVIGIDVQPVLVSRACEAAARRGIANARFDVADAYALSYPHESFDVVFANGVLMHLADARRALAEMHRVLRPGGIVAIRDPDFGAMLLAPASELLQRWLDLRIAVRRHNGGDPYLARQYRALLLDAGLVHAQASASLQCAGSVDRTAAYAGFLKAQLEGYAPTVLAQAWMSRPTLDAVVADIDAWGAHPAAFAAAVWCEAIAWKRPG